MRIWSTKGFTEINRQNREFLQGYLFEEIKAATNFRVGIVGGGPKGTYAIERLSSIWHSHLPDEKLEIVCFNNDVHFASGPNYLPDQPDYLLINYSLGNVNFWTEEPDQLVDDRTSLLDFINIYREKSGPEARPDEFCSRALTGIYLQHSLCQVISSLPDTIRVQLVPNAVTSIDFNGGELALTSEMQKVHSFSEVILCTGHSYSFQDEMSQRLRKQRANLIYVEHIYPIAQLNNTGFTGKDIFIQGMGLTFVDAVLGLTEGMGGRFDSSENSMVYIPSGLEPATIYPFSRSGLPMLARKAGGSETLCLAYFTDKFTENLLVTGNKIDFDSDIYPVIEKEYRYQFVRNLLTKYDGLFHSGDLSLEELEGLAQSTIPDFTPFDLENFLLPTSNLKFGHNEVIDYLEQSISPDHFSLVVQSTQEMSAVWRAIYPKFSMLYKFGALSGESHKQVDRVYFRKFQRVSYGPPIWNMRKIQALAKANIIRFDIGNAPSLIVNEETQKFEIRSQNLPERIESKILINARIAKMADINSHPPIYKHIHDQYGISLYQNEDYSPGCFNLDKKGALLTVKGVTLNGTPTEGWTLDNESLSRTNNNFITPWAKKIAYNYVSTTSQTNPYCPSVD